jgi:hypothetical protein
MSPIEVITRGHNSELVEIKQTLADCLQLLESIVETILRKARKS